MIKIKKKQQLTGHKGAVYALADGPDFGTFYSGAGDGWVVLWDIKKPNEGKLVANVKAPIVALYFVRTQNLLLAGDLNGGVHWLFLEENKPHRHIAKHTKGVFGFLKTQHGFFSIGGDGILVRWNMERQQAIESIQISHQALRTIEQHIDPNLILLGASDDQIYVYNQVKGSLEYTIAQAHENSIFTIKQHPTKPVFYSGSRDARLKKWDSVKYSFLAKQKAHLFTVNDLMFDPTTKYLFSASRDKTIKVWNAQSMELLKVLEAARDGGHINSVNQLLWLKERNCFVSASDDQSIIIWETGEEEEK